MPLGEKIICKIDYHLLESAPLRSLLKASELRSG